MDNHGSKGYPIRIGLCLFGDLLCKNLRSKRELHTEIAKNTKERTINGSKGYPIRIGLCLFGDLLCKSLRSEREFHTEIAKNTKERTTTDRKGVSQSKSIFATFAISV
jgi:hypothetical protein